MYLLTEISELFVLTPRITFTNTGLTKKFIWVFLHHFTGKLEQNFWPTPYSKFPKDGDVQAKHCLGRVSNIYSRNTLKFSLRSLSLILRMIKFSINKLKSASVT